MTVKHSYLLCSLTYVGPSCTIWTCCLADSSVEGFCDGNGAGPCHATDLW